MNIKSKALCILNGRLTESEEKKIWKATPNKMIWITIDQGNRSIDQ